MLIATLLDDDKTSPKYAQEATDLLDILRQRSEGLDLNEKELAQFRKIENTARSVLESFQTGQDEASSKADAKDIATGLLTDPHQDEDRLMSSPTKNVTTQLEHADLTKFPSSSSAPVPEPESSQPWIVNRDDTGVSDGKIIPKTTFRSRDFSDILPIALCQLL